LVNSAGGPSGSYTGDVVLAQPPLRDDGGYSVYFAAGFDKFGSLPARGIKDLEFTAVATVNMDTIATIGTVLSIGDSGVGSVAGWHFKVWTETGNTELRFTYYASGTWTSITSTGLGDIRGANTHVAVEVDFVTHTIRYYKNGVMYDEKGLTAVSGPGGTYYDKPLYIGTSDFNATTTTTFRGFIDEALYFPTLIGPDAIAALYSLPSGGAAGGTSYNAFLRRRRR